MRVSIGEFWTQKVFLKGTMELDTNRKHNQKKINFVIFLYQNVNPS